MTETALKEKAITYIGQLSSTKMNLALVYLKDLAESDFRQLNSKTEQERIESAKALAELDKIRLRLKLDNSFDNDKKSVANAIWKKYESLD